MLLTRALRASSAVPRAGAVRGVHLLAVELGNMDLEQAVAIVNRKLRRTGIMQSKQKDQKGRYPPNKDTYEAKKNKAYMISKHKVNSLLTHVELTRTEASHIKALDKDRKKREKAGEPPELVRIMLEDSPWNRLVKEESPDFYKMIVEDWPEKEAPSRAKRAVNKFASGGAPASREADEAAVTALKREMSTDYIPKPPAAPPPVARQPAAPAAAPRDRAAAPRPPAAIAAQPPNVINLGAAAEPDVIILGAAEPTVTAAQAADATAAAPAAAAAPVVEAAAVDAAPASPPAPKAAPGALPPAPKFTPGGLE
ncbi:hypothetical protein M885DRAFT_623123 [Pelagophyceae sp. CCMP2097]|nr:hypothetical protein M885DRAFT_623123 [Pelagophyceae sp. CCMP2097]